MFAKRVLLALLLALSLASSVFGLTAAERMLLVSSGIPASYTFAYKDKQATTSAGDTISLSNVAAGDTIVISVYQGNYSSGLTSISDGTTNFTLTQVTKLSAANYYLQLGYLESSSATGTVTYTCSPTGQAQRISIMRFTKSGGTVSIDTYSNPGAQSSGSQANATSPAISTSGNDLVIGVTSNNANSATSPLIGGSAAAGSVGNAAYDFMFYQIYTSAQSNITASVTQASDYWAAMILALKVQ
jgi:hypothetical protein